MYKHTKLLIFAKQIDGGTGTFVGQLNQLNKYLKNTIITTLVLDKPLFRKTIYKYRYFSNYPQQENTRYKLIIPLLCNFIREFFWLRKYILSTNPDLIISVDSHCNLLICLIKFFYFWKEYKIFITFHNNISAVSKVKLSKFQIIILKIFGKILFSYANKVIGVSQGVSDNIRYFFNLNLKNTLTIYYGLDLTISQKNIISKKFRYLFKQNIKNIVSVGRFVKQKDWFTLIKAFKAVHEKIVNSHLIIIGDGEEKNDLIRLINKNHLTRNITLLPWQQNIYPFLIKSDLFVLSSYYEGFPYILLEAMQSHIPIVATDTLYGPQELLARGKYGILVPIEDIESMSSAIIKILSNNQLKKTIVHLANSRIKNYSLQNMLLQYSGLIENMVKV